MSSSPTSSSAATPEACPVDHKSREAWLSQARAAAAASDSQSQSQLPPNHPPVPAAAAADESCPVDHKAREAWLEHARNSAADSGSPASSARPLPSASTTQLPLSQSTQSSSWSSSITSWLPSFGSSSPATQKQQQQLQSQPPKTGGVLDTGREISTIPRASSMPSRTPSATDNGAATSHGSAASSRPANQEQETGADAATGNWVYPSEKMFFEAMKRKGHDPQSADMRTVVPIHNAVNERAWAEIKKWEGPWVEGTSCGGPRLHSFSGLSTKLSPKARFNTLLGYQSPFDRHDWVVDRCGKEIEYVIDFYAGRPGGDSKLSFYLDVRPKLNSWDGIKMRAMRGLGIM
ncbi:cytochrome c-type heme lyase [Apiospora kogelbergensis]|uniref:cytochrome c-type heme lyase n=1 Tax=Apiospora kogelbergensis TaxID=1337665 RepID=UPI00312DCB68